MYTAKVETTDKELKEYKGNDPSEIINKIYNDNEFTKVKSLKLVKEKEKK